MMMSSVLWAAVLGVSGGIVYMVLRLVVVGLRALVKDWVRVYIEKHLEGVVREYLVELTLGMPATPGGHRTMGAVKVEGAARGMVEGVSPQGRSRREEWREKLKGKMGYSGRSVVMPIDQMDRRAVDSHPKENQDD